MHAVKQMALNNKEQTSPPITPYIILSYRVTSGVDGKWQTAHLGYLADVWKTSKLRLGILASANRLIWDRGWHRGNTS